MAAETACNYEDIKTNPFLSSIVFSVYMSSHEWSETSFINFHFMKTSKPLNPLLDRVKSAQVVRLGLNRGFEMACIERKWYGQSR